MGKALEPFVCGNSVDLMLEDGPVRATGAAESASNARARG